MEKKKPSRLARFALKQINFIAPLCVNEKPLSHSHTLFITFFPRLSGCFSLLRFFTSSPRSGICHSSRLYSLLLLIFDCSVTTCLHLPETLGQGASENAACKRSIHPSALALQFTCDSLMPAVSSHYLIGIEMHLACVFVCTALLVEIASHPSLL